MFGIKYRESVDITGPTGTSSYPYPHDRVSDFLTLMENPNALLDFSGVDGDYVPVRHVWKFRFLSELDTTTAEVRLLQDAAGCLYWQDPLERGIVWRDANAGTGPDASGNAVSDAAGLLEQEWTLDGDTVGITSMPAPDGLRVIASCRNLVLRIQFDEQWQPIATGNARTYIGEPAINAYREQVMPEDFPYQHPQRGDQQ